jgi:hypothetical protein
MGLTYYECARLPPQPRPYFKAAFPIVPEGKLYDESRAGKLQYIDVKAYVDTRARCSAVSSHLVKACGLPINRYKRPKSIPVPGGYIISLGTVTNPFLYRGERRWLSKQQVKQPRVEKSWLRGPWVPRRFWVDIHDFETPDSDSDSNDSEMEKENSMQSEDGEPPTKDMMLEVIDDCPRDLILGAEFINKFDIFTKRRFHILSVGTHSESSSGHRSRYSHSSRYSRSSRSSRSSRYSRGSRYSSSSSSSGRGWLHNILDRQRYRLGLRR